MVAANDGPPGPPPAGDIPVQGAGAGGGTRRRQRRAQKRQQPNKERGRPIQIYWKHYGNEGTRFSTSTRE